jgi:hypothetical protein
MTKAYLQEIRTRIDEPGDRKTWIEVGFVGNASFKQVYHSMWTSIEKVETEGWSVAWKETFSDPHTSNFHILFIVNNTKCIIDIAQRSIFLVFN